MVARTVTDSRYTNCEGKTHTKLLVCFFVKFDRFQIVKGLKMTEVEIKPADGKTSFSGIPESQFIDDVDSYMKVKHFFSLL